MLVGLRLCQFCVSAFAAGLGLTALLQSSTATALITSSFTAEGLVGLVPALAIMLGANVGTTLIVQLLSFNISAVAPILFIVGVVSFRSGARSRVKDVGRVFIGLGLMLLALHILLTTLAPAENAPGVRVFMSAITGDPNSSHTGPASPRVTAQAARAFSFIFSNIPIDLPPLALRLREISRRA